MGIITTIVLVSALIFFSTTGAKYLRFNIPHRKLTPYEEEYLNPILNEVFEKAKIKNPPKVFIIDNPDSNAMVVGDALILYTGLLIMATHEEVAAVIAHEVGHIVNRDLTMTTLNYAASQMSDWMIWLGLGIITVISLNGRIPFIYLSFFIMAVILKLIRWILLSVVRFNNLLIHRKCEYKADKYAAKLGYREASISYLSKIRKAYPMTDKSSLFNTHPTISKRILALSSL